jgi:methyl-accepting chemotaxis protein
VGSVVSVAQAAICTAEGAEQLRGSAVELAEVAGSLDILVTEFKLE